MTLIPFISGSRELKSKPTQHSVKELLSIGIQPDILVCRTEMELPDDMKQKLALFCNVKKECVIQNLTADSIYEVPILLEREGLGKCVCERFGIEDKPDLTEWTEMLDKVKHPAKKVKIALVGKYVELHDAYLSVAEALTHGGYANSAEVEIGWVQSEDITDENAAATLKDYDGIIVPGGFGDRGIEGMISAIKYARENDIPLFGICLGMQMLVVEAARSLAGMCGANSAEFSDTTEYPVIDIMPEQKLIDKKGGTMRLGLYPCYIKAGTKAHAAYGEDSILERHRHRFEVNNDSASVSKKLESYSVGCRPTADSAKSPSFRTSTGLSVCSSTPNSAAVRISLTRSSATSSKPRSTIRNKSCHTAPIIGGFYYHLFHNYTVFMQLCNILITTENYLQ